MDYFEYEKAKEKLFKDFENNAKKNHFTSIKKDIRRPLEYDEWTFSLSPNCYKLFKSIETRLKKEGGSLSGDWSTGNFLLNRYPVSSYLRLNIDEFVTGLGSCLMNDVQDKGSDIAKYDISIESKSCSGNIAFYLKKPFMGKEENSILIFFNAFRDREICGSVFKGIKRKLKVEFDKRKKIVKVL